MVSGALRPDDFIDLIEYLEHVLVRLLQSKFFGDLVQWQVYVTLQVADSLQALVEVEGVFLTDSEQEGDAAAGKVLSQRRRHCLLDFLPQLKQFVVADHDINEEVQVGEFRDLRLRAFVLLALFEKPDDHVLCLEAAVHLVLELAVVDECAHDLQN